MKLYAFFLAYYSSWVMRTTLEGVSYIMDGALKETKVFITMKNKFFWQTKNGREARSRNNQMTRFKWYHNYFSSCKFPRKKAC